MNWVSIIQQLGILVKYRKEDAPIPREHPVPHPDESGCPLGVLSMESREHRLLKQVALRWLQQTGCVAFACEVSFDFIGIVDAAGIKSCGDVYVVEAKISQRDFDGDFRRKARRLDKHSRFRLSTKAFDFLYYVVADGIDTSKLDTSIGILDATGRVQRRCKRRDRLKTPEGKCKDFCRFASACSWRAYGHVIRHEQQQLEFSLEGELGK